MSRIGKLIKEERTKKGMSPKQLGRKCGVSESFILDVENGSKIINEKLVSQISKVLGKNLDQSMILEDPKEDEKKKEINSGYKPANNNTAIKRSNVEPLEQWEEALSNIIKKIPIYDMKMSSIKGYKSFPIINKKVEGFNPDKLIYIKIEDDNLDQYRMKKGDRCLVYLNHELINNTFQLVEYDNKKYIRKVKRVHGNKVQLIEGMKNDKMILKDMKDIKILGRLIRVEIDF